VPIAEHTGFISDLGNWIIREASLQVKAWREKGLNDVRMAMNLSAVQLRSDSLESDIVAIIEETGVDPDWLEFEVTETALMDDIMYAQKVLERIRDLGSYIAIDDFGTGYSSLSHLKHFVIDKLKIDKSFIRDVMKDNRDAAVVGATIAMAKLLNASVVAEGVETEEQLDFLRKRQCDIAQGFLLSRPMPGEEVEALLGAERSSDMTDQNAVTNNDKESGFERTQMFIDLIN
jgi:EAL domain-containing protein (putative c-di-GMP-specific phosphodiesterase class I)